MRFLAAIFAASAVVLCGCASNDGVKVESGSPVRNQTLKSGFAEETYVWESFVVSTNRIENAR